MEDKKDVLEEIKRALLKLKSEDEFLLKKAAHERSITHKLAIYLEEGFCCSGRWDVKCHVDTEYNKLSGKDKKEVRIERLVDCYDDLDPEDDDAKTVYPDIVVHRRGCSEHNLVVIEVKKSTSNSGCDKKKLETYIEDLDYRYGVFLHLNVGDSMKTADGGRISLKEAILKTEDKLEECQSIMSEIT